MGGEFDTFRLVHVIDDVIINGLDNLNVIW